MTRKLFSVLIAICIVIGVLPFTAIAVDAEATSFIFDVLNTKNVSEDHRSSFHNFCSLSYFVPIDKS